MKSRALLFSSLALTGLASAQQQLATPKPLSGRQPVPTAGSEDGTGADMATPTAIQLPCPVSIRDQDGGCLQASSAATLGMLFPLSEELFVASSGNVGMGTTNPAEALQIGEYFTTTEDVFIEMRTVGGGAELSQGLKMRSSNPFFGFDIVHDDGSTGLDIRRWDIDNGSFGSSSMFVDRKTGNIGLETTAPNEKMQLGTNSTPGDRYLAIRTSGGNIYKAGIKLSHFADDNGFVIESDETGPVNGLNISYDTGVGAQSGFYMSRITGDVGINTTTPDRKFSVVESVANDGVATFDNPDPAGFAGAYFEENNTGRGWVGHVNTSSIFGAPGSMQLGAQSADIVFSASPDVFFRERMRIERDGNVGIGTTAPAFLLHVNGSAGKPGGGSWSVASDERLKRNVEDLDGALDTLLALRGVTFEYKDPEAIGELAGERIGFLAQEVEEVVPDWVGEKADGFKHLTIRGFEALAVEALRELDAENQALRAELEARDAKLAELVGSVQTLTAISAQVEALEARLQILDR